jgi:PadR family transcriptional regulator, regulatory protein PadR
MSWYFVLHSTKYHPIFVLQTEKRVLNLILTLLHKIEFMNIENTQSQMRKGILEFCILSIIRRGEAYPSDIVEEMRAANLQILEGTLYPLLTRLKNADMLTYRWVESNSGPPRKYFLLTDKGDTFYKELEQTWNELSNGVNALANKNDKPLNQP